MDVASAGQSQYVARFMTRFARLDLLDPLEVSRLGGLEVITEGVVEGFLSGLHRSPRRGFSVEFAEHRMYQPGDELRYVDWKILGRNDRLYVKQFEEETNLRAMVVLRRQPLDGLDRRARRPCCPSSPTPSG